ncbi:hypothetical protein PanWU01x14_187610 [Parasponia andersonii]|uniref:Uncharacterized protein n=1 Tax=Parasponia andersonii TaxID=3476 RepID=A0A2P5C3J0_PARAD|nr:hypothetical protein PanWU01x14_187610 [Parasponia andersonii]
MTKTYSLISGERWRNWAPGAGQKGSGHGLSQLTKLTISSFWVYPKLS